VKRETEGEVHIVEYRTYAYVWVALLILLGLTIAVAEMEMSKYSVIANLLISSVKAILVLTFFMHLKYEGAFLRRLLITVLCVLTFVIMLTFSDVWYR